MIKLLSSSTITLQSSFVIPGAATSTTNPFSSSRMLIAGTDLLLVSHSLPKKSLNTLGTKSLNTLGNQLVVLFTSAIVVPSFLIFYFSTFTIKLANGMPIHFRKVYLFKNDKMT
ncbi:MAG: hypothetical protein BWZ06_01658 [Bacteroidetes bacterium ADurb.BinA261]|nr:MAG: hypothetical protein BWZ06_01658 [Bacteroidetes bacterium ADurb.BinA261]